MSIPRQSLSRQSNPVAGSRAEIDSDYGQATSVLMLSHYFPPSGASGVFRTMRFVKYLPMFGWRPVIVAELPAPAAHHDYSLLAQIPSTAVIFRTRRWRPDEQISSLARCILRFRESATGEHALERLPVEGASEQPPSPAFFTWLRNLRDLLFLTPDAAIWWLIPAVKSALSATHQLNPSVIYSSGPPHSAHVVGIVLKQLTGLPFVMDLRDPWARNPWGASLRNPWGQHWLQKLEGACVSRADLVILNTDRACSEFRAYYAGSEASKFIALPNGYDPDALTEVQQISRTTRKKASDQPFRLCHPGSLAELRDPRPLLTAIAQLRRSGWSVLFEQYGECDDKFHVNSTIRDLELETCVLLGVRIDHAAILHRMAVADAFVLLQPETSLQVPGKLYEMLMFRKPIVAITGPGETAALIEQFNLGVVVHPDDRQGIASAIAYVMAGRLEGEDYRGWEDALAAFDGKHLTERLAAALDSLCPNHRSP